MTYAQLMAHGEEIRRRAIAATMSTVDDDEPRRRAAVERAFADVPEAFRAFAALPDPARFDPKLDGLAAVLRGLSTGDDPVAGRPIPSNVDLARIGSTISALARWTGPAAVAFRTGFLEPLPAIVRNQFVVAAVLRGALQAQREIWVRARADVDQIAEKTLDAIDATADCTRNEWTITFTVVASVAALAVVPLSGGAALAVTAISAGAQVVAATGPEEPARTAFSGGSPAEVVERMRDALRMLGGHVREQQESVARVLRQAHALVSGNRALFAPGGTLTGDLGYAH